MTQIAAIHLTGHLQTYLIDKVSIDLLSVLVLRFRLYRKMKTLLYFYVRWRYVLTYIFAFNIKLFYHGLETRYSYFKITLFTERKRVKMILAYRKYWDYDELKIRTKSSQSIEHMWHSTYIV